MVHDPINFPVGFSAVPLVKSVLTEKREFLPTESEWRAKNEVQFGESGQALQGNSTTLYTVPAGKESFLTNCYLSIANDPDSTADATATLRIQTGTSVRIEIFQVRAQEGQSATDVTGSHVFLAYNLNMPVKMFGGESLVINNTSSQSAVAAGGGIGWEQFKEVTPTQAPPQ